MCCLYVEGYAPNHMNKLVIELKSNLSAISELSENTELLLNPRKIQMIMLGTKMLLAKITSKDRIGKTNK